MSTNIQKIRVRPGYPCPGYSESDKWDLELAGTRRKTIAAWADLPVEGLVTEVFTFRSVALESDGSELEGTEDLHWFRSDPEEPKCTGAKHKWAEDPSAYSLGSEVQHLSTCGRCNLIRVRFFARQCADGGTFDGIEYKPPGP